MGNQNGPSWGLDIASLIEHCCIEAANCSGSCQASHALLKMAVFRMQCVFHSEALLFIFKFEFRGLLRKTSEPDPGLEEGGFFLCFVACCHSPGPELSLNWIFVLLLFSS